MPLIDYQQLLDSSLRDSSGQIFKEQYQTPTRLLGRLMGAYKDKRVELPEIHAVRYCDGYNPQFSFGRKEQRPLPFRIYDVWIAALKPMEDQINPPDRYSHMHAITMVNGSASESYQVRKFETEQDSPNVYSQFPEFIEICNAFFSRFPEYRVLLTPFPVLDRLIKLNFAWCETAMYSYIDTLIEKETWGHKITSHNSLLFWQEMTDQQKDHLTNQFLNKFETRGQAISACNAMGAFLIRNSSTKGRRELLYQHIIRLLTVDADMPLPTRDQWDYSTHMTETIPTVVALFETCEEHRQHIEKKLFEMLKQFEHASDEQPYHCWKMALTTLAMLYPHLENKALLLDVIKSTLNQYTPIHSDKWRSNEVYFFTLEIAFLFFHAMDTEGQSYFASKLLEVSEEKGMPITERVRALQTCFSSLNPEQKKTALHLQSRAKYPSFSPEQLNGMEEKLQAEYIGKMGFDTLLLLFKQSQNKELKYKALVLLLEAIKLRGDPGLDARKKIVSLEVTDAERELIYDTFLEAQDAHNKNFKRIYFSRRSDDELDGYGIALQHQIEQIKSGTHIQQLKRLAEDPEIRQVEDSTYFHLTSGLNRETETSPPRELLFKLSEKAQEHMLDEFSRQAFWNGKNAFATACYFYSKGSPGLQHYILSTHGFFAYCITDKDVPEAMAVFRKLSREDFSVVQRHLQSYVFASTHNESVNKAFILVNQIAREIKNEHIMEEQMRPLQRHCC